MQIKLSRLKQIIQEVVEERYASERMDDIIQSTREEETIEETIEETNPHDQALDEMIAEEIEAAMGKFVVAEKAENKEMVVQTAKELQASPQGKEAIEQLFNDPKFREKMDVLLQQIEQEHGGINEESFGDQDAGGMIGAMFGAPLAYAAIGMPGYKALLAAAPLAAPAIGLTATMAGGAAIATLLSYAIWKKKQKAKEGGDAE